MGIELKYQALPAGCGFVELVREIAREDPREANSAHAIMFWFRHGQVRNRHVYPAPGSEEDYPEGEKGRAFWEWCCMAAGRFPGIADRYLNLYGSERALHFMLSAKERAERRWPPPAPTDPRSWNDPVGAFDAVIGQAFHDAPPIAPGVVAGQGAPVRLIPQSVVEDIGMCIGALEFKEVAPHLDEYLGYRRDKEFYIQSYTERFIAFQTFFVAAAEKRESVMVVYD